MKNKKTEYCNVNEEVDYGYWMLGNVVIAVLVVVAALLLTVAWLVL